MDSRTGKLYSHEEVARMPAEQRRRLIQLGQVTQLQRIRKRIGRNDLCPCGSGRKFKKCCLAK
jgi:preprotein translocase subunit SecA